LEDGGHLRAMLAAMITC